MTDLGHDLGVDADQVVAAHARLARHTGGDDHDIGALDGGIVIGSGVVGIDALDRSGLGDIQGLALRDAFSDVEHYDVAQLLQADQMSQGAADIAGANESDFFTCHGNLPLGRF